MRTKHKRAYKYRMYPTREQERVLARTFGCARFVYNYFLRLRKQAYFQEQQTLAYHDTSALLTALKKQAEYAWLNEVSCVPTQQALRHLDRAFQNFFEGRAQYPVFKNKRGEQSAEYTTSAFTWDGTHLTLARMEEPLAIRWSRPLPPGAKPTTITVTRDTANRYFVSILVEEEIRPLPVVKSMVGLDLGLTSMVVLSSRIVRENQVVCVESLAVKNMLKNHALAKSISDVGWGEFVRQLEYKARWYGRTFVKIDRWYPSSKQCFECGHVLDSLSLDERFWTCPACGRFQNRDGNAAKNVLAEGLSVSACGEAVRPNTNGTVEGTPRRNRKPPS